ncbi:MAG TPA: toxin-antitoxin system YwqK family antitoxin [Bacteroidales bacterium]|nr:toxin-antitoxin system YwqK family antitoxin [Bacteroidales bacterium]
MRIKEADLIGLFSFFVFLPGNNIEMNIKIKSAVIFLILVFHLPASSQTTESINHSDENGRKQGHWIKKYPNGNIMYDGYFTDDRPSGEFKRYYEDNTLKSILVFNKSGEEAEATLYYPNGLPSSRGKYLNQMKEGKWQFYSPSNEGVLISEEEFSSDKRNGVSVTFYPDSTVAERIHYTKGIRNGEWHKYYPDGSPMLKTNYRNGRLHGKFEGFFENGKHEFLGNYRDDLKDGLWIIYKKDGSVRFKTTYTAGMPDNRQKDIYETNFIDSLERSNRNIPDPEKTGEPW